MQVAISLALAFTFPGFSWAADWEVDPVRIDLTQEQQTAVINVKNNSDQETKIQIDAVAWSQQEGKDVYTTTRELLVSPPIFTIPPNSQQIIRTALRRATDTTNELTYRINLVELPGVPVADLTGVQVALRLGLPVFVQPQKGGAAPKLSWSASRMSGNKIKVILKNQGNAHIQVSDFALYAPSSKEPVAIEPISVYVLAGQTKEWLLESKTMSKLASGGHMHLKASTDAGDVDTEIVLDKP
jgi:fimbrial chaperone protein